MKVGFSDYYEPKSNDWIVVESARETFVATINTVAPEVPRELLATLQESQANSRLDLKSRFESATNAVRTTKTTQTA